jgi:Gamma tubulin complex component C-terminal
MFGTEFCDIVETVSRGLFNSIIKGSDIFTGQPEVLALLHRFRFHSHAFVSTLITYVFDTAIGIHLDGFMTRVQDIATQHAMRTSQSASPRLDSQGDITNGGSYNAVQVYVDDDTKPVADVFEIMDDHSIVLDKILGSCVLRTPQRAISDVLEDILSLVLRLGSLIRDLRRGALTNEAAAAQLQKLHYNFERKMITFVSVQNIQLLYLPPASRMTTTHADHEHPVFQHYQTKVLRAMDDKSELRSLLSALATSDRDYEVLSRNAGGKKREIGLSDLLARLDPGEWWKQETERRARAKKDRQVQSPA